MGHNIDLSLYLLPPNICFSFIPPTFELPGSLSSKSVLQRAAGKGAQGHRFNVEIICKLGDACV